MNHYAADISKKSIMLKFYDTGTGMHSIINNKNKGKQLQEQLSRKHSSLRFMIKEDIYLII